jgi:hypothetical protein
MRRKKRKGRIDNKKRREGKRGCEPEVKSGRRDEKSGGDDLRFDKEVDGEGLVGNLHTDWDIDGFAPTREKDRHRVKERKKKRT